MSWIGRVMRFRQPAKTYSGDLAGMVLGQLREDPEGVRRRLREVLSDILLRPVILQTTKTKGLQELATLFGFSQFDSVIAEEWWTGDADIYRLAPEDWLACTIIVEKPPYQSMTRFRRERWRAFVCQLEELTGRVPEIHPKGHLIFR